MTQVISTTEDRAALRTGAARTGGQLIVEQLEAEGVTTAYCVPGESYLEVLDALYDSAIRLVTCRHEGGAGYMAVADARLSGDVGVCLVTRGPGAANAMVAVHMAAKDATPLVLLVGLVPRADVQRDAFQEFELSGWFASTTKAVLTIDTADRVPELLSKAFGVARSGRPGPVVVGLPEDMLRDPAVGVGAVSAIRPLTRPAPPAAVAELAALVEDAERPLVVLGPMGWTPRTSLVVQAWAEARGLPVAVEYNALDLIDSDSPAFVGPLGFGRSELLADELRTADLVIGIGSALGDVVTDSWELLPPDHPGTRIVTVLPETDPLSSVHANVLRISGTPEDVIEVAHALGAPEVATARALRAARLRADLTQRREGARVEAAPLDLDAVFRRLDDVLDNDAIITWGAGNHATWGARFLSWHGYPSLLAPRNGSMGFGVPAAVAAAIRHPGRQVVSVAGDGCFLMNGQELAVAAAAGAAPLILVVNNSMYGTIRAHQEQRHPRRPSGTDLVNPDFAAFARAFGGHGEVVETTEDFERALQRSLAAGVPAIIELRVTDGRLSPDATIDSLRGDVIRGQRELAEAQR
ncbi:thiamine pyrophosphate-dependent enzyme [Microbacterium sp. CCH5-D1]|uniref:thiamine pyrophosphate-dependent enzyme n=1 Tax=Microbacterium sp. CCH5-D1 TaxID=1768780 RepID=UPI000A8A14FC|nr:thiamine pyrophosphate-dependent enzyme [Microbacterium sp. CCH5-D1]